MNDLALYWESEKCRKNGKYSWKTSQICKYRIEVTLSVRFLPPPLKFSAFSRRNIEIFSAKVRTFPTTPSGRVVFLNDFPLGRVRHERKFSAICQRFCII